MNPRHLPRWLALLLAFVLVAAACGGSSDDTESTDADGESSEEAVEAGSFDEQAAEEQERTGDEEEEPVTEEPEADELQTGGTLVISGPSDIASLDPITSSSFNTQYRIAGVYQRLITFDSGPDIGYTAQVLKPELATDWEISDDLLTYTFTLRDGVTWHDVEPVNGRPFTSADVKATLDNILEQGHQGALLETVTSVEAPDDLTVVLNLSEPFAPLLNNMASHFMWILPAEAFEEGYDRTNTVIGTGPFVMDEREVDVKTSYVRNPSYWDVDENGNQLPYLDGIETLVINDTQQVIAAFKAGEIDIMTNAMSPELRDQLMGDFPDAFYGEWIDAGMGQIGINMEREPFNDLRVRQAISLAIDRDGMGNTIRGGGTVPSNVAPALADYVLPEEERREYLYYDPERARELLAEAGFPDGLDATVIATDRYGANYTAQTEWLIEDLKAVGINATLEMLDYATYFGSRWPDVEYDIQFGPQTPFLEPDEWLRLQMRTGAARNWYNLSDPDLDALIDEQLTIVDPAERAEKIREIQRYALENVMNPIPVWTYFSQWSYSPQVQNFFRHGSYGYAGIERVWLAE
ncbi:MAG: ABC transporter substrate-binding protein [Actinomycetota bacterium]